MNELMNQNQPKTMSSLEIAELCEKQHKNVLADIRKMLNELGLSAAEFSATENYTKGKGATGSREVFNLPRRECDILVSGYNIKYRAAIVDRWQELEAKQIAAPVPMITGDSISSATMMIANLLPAVDRSLLAAQALNQIQKNTGDDMSEIMKALPARTTKRATLNATKAGELVGLSARSFNIAMSDSGYQFKNERDEWELTSDGLEYAEQKPYERGGHTGYQILWFDTVTELFE